MPRGLPPDAPAGRDAGPVTQLVIAFGPPLLITAAVILQPWVEPRWAFMDPVAAAQTSQTCCSAYYGFVSNIGILYWWGAAVACGFAAMLLHRGGHRRDAVFLGAAAMLSGALSIDDLLLLHERILPRIGVPQLGVLAAIALTSLAYLGAYRRRLFRRGDLVFPVAMACLGLSLALDVLIAEQPYPVLLLEDALKFLGIAGWSVHHAGLAAALTRAPRG